MCSRPSFYPENGCRSRCCAKRSKSWRHRGRASSGAATRRLLLDPRYCSPDRPASGSTRPTRAGWCATASSPPTPVKETGLPTSATARAFWAARHPGAHRLPRRSSPCGWRARGRCRSASRGSFTSPRRTTGRRGSTAPWSGGGHHPWIDIAAVVLDVGAREDETGCWVQHKATTREPRRPRYSPSAFITGFVSPTPSAGSSDDCRPSAAGATAPSGSPTHRPRPAEEAVNPSVFLLPGAARSTAAAPPMRPRFQTEPPRLGPRRGHRRRLRTPLPRSQAPPSSRRTTISPAKDQPLAIAKLRASVNRRAVRALAWFPGARGRGRGHLRQFRLVGGRRHHRAVAQ